MGADVTENKRGRPRKANPLTAAERKRRQRAKQAQVKRVPVESIRFSVENEQLYRPIGEHDPEVQALVADIKKHGILEPLVISRDSYLVSGHRRLFCAELLGMKTIPVRICNCSYAGNRKRFVKLLRAYNLQRDKTREERFREELVSANPDGDPYMTLITHRVRSSRIQAESIELVGRKKRSIITPVKRQMVNAIKKVIFEDRRDYWPLSVRAVHYPLLNYKFFRNTKRRTLYVNDRKSYQDLSDLITRLRLLGEIPWEAVSDETRPVALWNVWASPRAFIREQLNGFLKGYFRDLLQSQPNHVEVVCEKNTIYRMVKDVTAKYCLPTMSGRGFSSIDPVHEIYERYQRSGKDTLVVIVCSDYDAEGQWIPQVTGRTLRDDFSVFASDVEIIKAAVTAEQIERYELPSDNEAKCDTARQCKFIAQFGEHAYELEALEPRILQAELVEVIDQVIDVEAFNAELDAEKEDHGFVSGIKQKAVEALKQIVGDGDEEW